MTGLLTLQQAADRLGFSRQRLHQLIKAGRLEPAEIVGRKVLTEAQVAAFLKAIKPGRLKFGPKSNGKRKAK